MYINFNLDTINYTGDQLRSLFNYETTGRSGDSIFGFIGEMDLKEKMIDMEDIREGDYIYSPKALNIIVELFHKNIETTVLYQRLLMQTITDELRKMFSFRDKVELEGDDIFYIGDVSCIGPEDERPKRKKMSVSIATVSPVSGLIHVGINIDVNDKIPVPAYGLGEAVNIENFFISIAKKFNYQYNSISKTTTKVKTVR